MGSRETLEYIVSWLVEHPDRYWPLVRFDVVGVVRRTPDGPSVTHLRGAF